VNFSALPVPTQGSRLEVVLGDIISQGRSGITHNARVSNVTGNQGAPEHFPKDLCLKFAKPRFSRSLAREAWFYEQLADKDGYEGIVTPKCYGFFKASLNDYASMHRFPLESLQMTPNVNAQASDPSEEVNSYASHGMPQNEVAWPLDYLPDDRNSGSYEEDDLGSKTKSPWNTYQETQNQPLVTVLVLEKLGRQYYGVDEEITHGGPKRRSVIKHGLLLHVGSCPPSRRDVRALYDDLSDAGILHGDIRIQNVLHNRKLKGVSDPICPRHGRAHRWRIVDFSLADRIILFNSPDIRYASEQKTHVGKGPFFGYAY